MAIKCPPIYRDYYAPGKIGHLLVECGAPLDLFTTHDDGEWLEWSVDSEVGRTVRDYLADVSKVVERTLDADVTPIWEVAARQCLTWAFG